MSKNAILGVLLLGLVILMFVLSRSDLASTIKTNKSNAKTSTNSNPVPTQKPALDRTIDINDVVTDPVVYSDLTLTLEGKINNWVTKNVYTFTPAKSGFGSSGKSLPVITKDNYKLPEDTYEKDLALGEIAVIRVTGKIVIFNRAELEQVWGIDLNDKELDRWNKTPVILVDKLEKL
jgi:hypothetical protein